MNHRVVEVGKQNREKVKEFVLNYYKENGEMPTYEEIRKAVGLSKSNIYEHYDAATAVGIKVTDCAWSR